MNAPNPVLTGLDLRAEIDRLRKERNAIVLAHYYQAPEIQDLADFVGDSLDLSRKAQATDADVIAFCGVRFMAETAKILSPQKTVILPDMDAGCSLEDSCPPDQFAECVHRICNEQGAQLTGVTAADLIEVLSQVWARAARQRVFGLTLKQANRLLRVDAPMQAANAARLAPNGTTSLLWKFTKAGTFEFSCLIPGHRESGMLGTVVVK